MVGGAARAGHFGGEGHEVGATHGYIIHSSVSLHIIDHSDKIKISHVDKRSAPPRPSLDRVLHVIALRVSHSCAPPLGGRRLSTRTPAPTYLGFWMVGLHVRLKRSMIASVCSGAT